MSHSPNTTRTGQLRRLRGVSIPPSGGRLFRALQTLSADRQVPVAPAIGERVVAHRPESETSQALSPSDRRQFPRHESGCVVAVCSLAEDAPLTDQQLDWQLHSTPLKGMLIDISLSGAAFLLAQPLDPNELLALRLSSRYVDRTADIEARVLRITQIGSWFKIVGRFRQNLAFEDVRDFGRAISGTDLV